ncbi:hypothetical protein GCM10020258_25550 [Sphingomonas yabuuchiae]
MREPDAMADTPQKSPETSPEKSETKDTLRFFLKLALFVFILRSLIVTSFVIPSESMLPRLLIGDYLFVTKWNYGYSRWSFPFGLPLLPGRILGRDPARGDVVVFRSPEPDDHDVIKRVIGLPGDTIQVREGQVFLNGRAIPKQRIADFILPLTPISMRTSAGRSSTPSPASRCAAIPGSVRRCRTARAMTCSTRAISPRPMIPASIPCPPITSS